MGWSFFLLVGSMIYSFYCHETLVFLMRLIVVSDMELVETFFVVVQLIFLYFIDFSIHWSVIHPARSISKILLLCVLSECSPRQNPSASLQQVEWYESWFPAYKRDVARFLTPCWNIRYPQYWALWLALLSCISFESKFYHGRSLSECDVLVLLKLLWPACYHNNPSISPLFCFVNCFFLAIFMLFHISLVFKCFMLLGSQSSNYGIVCIFSPLSNDIGINLPSFLISRVIFY